MEIALNTRFRFIFIIGILTLLALSAGGLFHWLSESSGSYPDLRVVRYSFTVRNTSTKVLPEAKVSIYAPVKRTSWQRTDKITASYPFKLTVDDSGNQSLEFRFADFPPHGTKVITVTAEVMTALTAQKPRITDLRAFLKEERYLEFRDERVTAIAAPLRGETSEETASALYKWVSSNVRYAGYVKEDRGALYAAIYRVGDCTEFAYLYSALARAQQIPSRIIAGFVVPEGATLRPQDFHNWSEILLDHRWEVVDAQKSKLMGPAGHYIAFRILSGQNPVGLNSHGLAMADPGLSVVMN